MKNISLQSIKWESVRSIFNIIAEKDTVCRSELSERTGLSLVTVGKVADALLSLDIVRQVKETRSSAGRRAGLLSVNDSNYTVICDLSTRNFFAVILDLRFKFKEKIAFTYSSEHTYTENLNAFFREVCIAVTNSYELENCYGIGLAVPGTYHPHTDSVESRSICELNGIHPKEFIDAVFGGLPCFIDSGVNAAARSNISAVADHEEKNILYWFIGETGSKGAFVVHGDILPGKNNHLCDFGEIRDVYGRTLSQKLTDSETPEEYARVLVLDMANIIRILSPHTIVIECDRFNTSEYKRNELISELVKNLLASYEFTEENLPEFIETGHIIRHAHRGIAMKLRDMWIHRIISGT